MHNYAYKKVMHMFMQMIMHTVMHKIYTMRGGRQTLCSVCTPHLRKDAHVKVQARCKRPCEHEPGCVSDRNVCVCLSHLLKEICVFLGGLKPFLGFSKEE